MFERRLASRTKLNLSLGRDEFSGTVICLAFDTIRNIQVLKNNNLELLPSRGSD